MGRTRAQQGVVELLRLLRGRTRGSRVVAELVVEGFALRTPYWAAAAVGVERERGADGEWRWRLPTSPSGAQAASGEQDAAP